MSNKVLDYDEVQRMVSRISETRVKKGDVLGDLDTIDVLEIFHELGIPYHRYISGGNLNSECRIRLRKLGEEVFGYRTMRGDHFEELANSQNVKGLLSKMTIVDLWELQNYEVAS